jgi:hypothetical protein
LFDIDKDNADRGTPSVNTHDKLPADVMMANGTLSTNYILSSPNPNGIQGVQLGALSLVQVGTAVISNNGSTLTTQTQNHGLGFAPYMVAALNNASISGISNPINLLLPTFLSASAGGVTTGAVTFGSYLYGLVDQYNAYFQMINATGSPISVTVTYYLYRQSAVQA